MVLKLPSKPERMKKHPTREEIQEWLTKETYYTFWARRVIAWRAAIFKHNPPHYCSICIRRSYCRRLAINGMVQDQVLRGELCMDRYTVWDAL